VRLQAGLVPWPCRRVRRLQIIIRDVTSRFIVFCSILALLWIPAGAQQVSKDLSDKSLEDLMDIEVTSVSKRAQTLSKVASAIFVITQDEIQHSGNTNIPDLLRAADT
jgi:outer membrane receptor for ferrienterochelin and colicin